MDGFNSLVQKVLDFWENMRNGLKNICDKAKKWSLTWRRRSGIISEERGATDRLLALCLKNYILYSRPTCRSGGYFVTGNFVFDISGDW